MATQNLIFQCVLSMAEVEELRAIKDELSDILPDFIKEQVANKKLNSVKLEFAILDLREVITNSVRCGYRWNSYVLSILILKLEYIQQVISPSLFGDNFFIQETIYRNTNKLKNLRERKQAEINS